jgi:SH3-like domain-containing protein
MLTPVDTVTIVTRNLYRLMCNKSGQKTTRTTIGMKKNLNRLFGNALKIVLVFGVTLIAPALGTPDGQMALAQQAGDTKRTVRGSGLPVPRFVTLKFDEANLRAGPGREYPVLWQYRKTGLPLLVDAEFGVWRKIIDHDGTSGWMHGSVLSLKRMALVRDHMAEILDDDGDGARVIAIAERHALLELDSCPQALCRVTADSVSGWIKRESIWGVLADESLK